jgi:hypothetical protein
MSEAETVMRQMTFDCTITSTMVSYIDLNDVSVPLSQGGTTWSGSATISLDDTLKIAVTVTGVTDSPWSVAITTKCPGGQAAKIFSRSGTVPHGGSEGFTTSVKVAPDPCVAGQGFVLEFAAIAARPKKAKKKKPAKAATRPTKTSRVGTKAAQATKARKKIIPKKPVK